VPNTEQDFLTTKMYRPPLPADCVQRSDLLRLIDAGRSRPLTLISAPAGYGKSVLVSSWLEASDWPSVWVSLDENDSDLKRFLSYLISAVRERFPQALATARSLHQESVLPETRVVANIVSNELNAIDQPFLLVLDDYHRIHAGSPVNDLLRVLLDHPPIPLHLVLITRRDPPLPLGRLRALGQVTDVRMQDLQFSRSETQDLLERAVHIRASEDAISNLEHELEGWVAGLRLLTLALRRAPDSEAFMKRLHGGTKQMQEYLISEAVAVLPKLFREWLLRSALLDRFCEPLCEAVCTEARGTQSDAISGQEFIEHLQSVNLFLIPLDAKGYWFRFHHLFQSLLQLELHRQLDEETIAALHMSASQWFEENGLIEEAIRSALKAGDSEAAADILERHRLDELEKLNFHIVARWLEALGQNTAGRPALQLAEAFVAVDRFDVPRLAAILEEVAPVVEENPDCANLMGELRFLQGVLSFRMGDGETSQKLLQDARHQFQTSEKRGIAGNAAFQEALSLNLCGRGDEVLVKFEDRANRAASGSPFYHCSLIMGLIVVSFFQGDLTRVVNYATRLKTLAQAVGSEFLAHGLSIFFQGCSKLYRGNFEAAAKHFDTLAQRHYPIVRPRAFDAMAALTLCHQLLQQESAAIRALGDLQTFARELNDAAGIKVAQSCEARIQLLQGDLERAARWAGFDSTPPMFIELYLSLEVPAITRARIWVALGTDESLHRAYTLLQEIGEQARSWHLANQLIETDVLKSLALAGLGREDEALECLAATIDLATQGIWMRPFLEPGKPMADLLVQLNAHGFATDFSRLLQSDLQAWHVGEANQTRPGSGLQMAPEAELLEPLTPRELDVLELLAQRLQNKEISDKLFVSPETIKSHLKNIYQKLDVGKRREAVEKAKKMGIV
jgi:LuxR family maltose regulon positive regulatory protein